MMRHIWIATAISLAYLGALIALAIIETKTGMFLGPL